MKILKRIPFLAFGCILFTQCYSIKWNDLNKQATKVKAPTEVQKIFASFSDSIMVLDAKCPAYNYSYDIGEKDALYGKDSLNLLFNKVVIKLEDKMPKGKVLANFTFIDKADNRIDIKQVDLLRLIPKLEGNDELVYTEMLQKEFNRFGYVFRREHHEFQFTANPKNVSEQLNDIIENTHRCKIVNNCLSPGKWELEVASEDFSDFKSRLKSDINLNQNKILAHSWFYMHQPLYDALLKIKNPDKQIDVSLKYDELSNRGEQTFVDFSNLRKPLKYQLQTEIIEIGHQSERALKPLDREQHYKKQFGLFLNNAENTYASILETPVKLTQFRDEGFYSNTNIRDFNFNWMKEMDDVKIDVIDVSETDAYVQIALTGKNCPYTITLGNIDMAQLSEQSMMGFLFGINTYPKNRRYNPVQSTIAYDHDLLPKDLKPYLMLTDNFTEKWVNNQYKGIEKLYVSYESLERNVLEIYMLSYERITPVWMARVELPKAFREQIRIRKNLYN